MLGLFELYHDTDFERPRSRMTAIQRLSDLRSTREDISMSSAEELTRDSLIREIFDALDHADVDVFRTALAIAVQSTRQR
jgi:hypothetical protein